MCMITFRSWAATLCIVLPLVLTSVLGNALMAFMGIGVKVATLPVVALGVGIGVDYGIYIYSRLESFLRAGLPLQEAYYQTLRSEEHTSELQSLMRISYAVFCLKKKNNKIIKLNIQTTNKTR